MTLSKKAFICLAVFLSVLASVFLGLGIVGLTIGPRILQNQISLQLPLRVDSDQVSSWESPPVPIYLQFWLWECVNVAEVLKGDKPMLRQVGPFTYAERRQKHEVVFNENYTISYRQSMSYTFIRDQSIADEGVRIKMVNAFVVTLVTLVQKEPTFVQEALGVALNVFDETLFVTHTAGEWIWGYEDPILKAIKNNPILSRFVNLTDDRFGYFEGQNGTDDGLYTVFTGATNIDLLNNINKWQGVSDVPYWPHPYASQINGTDGSWFPPLFQRDLQSQRLYLFSTDVCRSLYAKWSSHSTVSGIPTEVFAIPSELFVNSSVNPDNAPFGLNVSGVLDVSRCRQGAPIFISFPHFLYTDDSIRDLVQGLDPHELDHRVTFDVEPHTGLVLSAQKRLQINVLIRPDKYVSDFRAVTRVILPAIWINESTTIDQDSADSLKSQVLKLFTTVFAVSVTLVCLGGVLFVVILALYIRRRNSPYESSERLAFVHSRNSIANDNDG